MVHSEQQHCLGYRIEYQDRTLAYSGDAAYAPNLMTLCRNVDVAILDCSFPKNRPESHTCMQGNADKSLTKPT